MAEAKGGSGTVNSDVVVIKINKYGEIVWMTQLGHTTKVSGGDNSGEDWCNRIKIDDQRNVYCAGVTNGSMGETNGGGGNNDVIILKLNSDGELQWLKQFGANTSLPGGNNFNSESPNGIYYNNANDKIYITGSTNGSFVEQNAGNWDIFFLKLNSLGNLD